MSLLRFGTACCGFTGHTSQTSGSTATQHRYSSIIVLAVRVLSSLPAWRGAVVLRRGLSPVQVGAVSVEVFDW